MSLNVPPGILTTMAPGLACWASLVGGILSGLMRGMDLIKDDHRGLEEELGGQCVECVG